MKIKLIIIDIDGTLLNDQGKLLDSTKNTIIAAQEAGVKVILATSRALPEAIKYSKILHIDQYAGHVICFNGCVIYNLKTSEYLWNVNLNREDTKYIYDVIKKYDFNFWGYGLNRIAYIAKKDVNINRLIKVNPSYEVKLLSKKQPLLPCYKVSIGVQNFDFDIIDNFKIEIEANRRLKIASATLARNTYWDIMLFDFNKAKALKFLTNRWKIKMKECLAIGDSLNDYELLKQVKYGVMPKNGNSELIKVIYDICDSNNDDGVGKTISKYIYSDKKIKRMKRNEK